MSMRKVIKNWILVCLVVVLNSFLYRAQAQSGSLKINDDFIVGHDYKFLDTRSKVDLARTKSDLIILDFFTTSCTSCIASFPLLNEIQKKYGNKLSIITITPERKERVSTFFKNNHNTKVNVLPVVIEDTILNKVFRHKSVPHLVWIYHNKVVAITAKDMLTESSIDQVLANEPISNWPIKNDYAEINLVAEENRDEYTTRFSKFQQGYPSKYKVDTLGGKVHYQILNGAPIPSLLYLLSLDRQLPLMKTERIKFNIANKERFLIDKSIPKSIWMQKYGFCYSSDWPLDMPLKDRVKALFDDLSLRLHVKANLSKELAHVWVVKNKEDYQDRVIEEADVEIEIWCQFLEIMNEKFPPIYLEDIDPRKKLKTYEVTDFNSLKEALNKNGFTLEIGQRNIECLIISER